MTDLIEKLQTIVQRKPQNKSKAAFFHTYVEEDIRAAAKREVLEETGIDTEFVSLVCFRHIPDFRLECSDLYFVCLMKPLNKDIKKDPTEISDAKWIDVSMSYCTLYKKIIIISSSKLT